MYNLCKNYVDIHRRNTLHYYNTLMWHMYTYTSCLISDIEDIIKLYCILFNSNRSEDPVFLNSTDNKIKFNIDSYVLEYICKLN